MTMLKWARSLLCVAISLSIVSKVGGVSLKNDEEAGTVLAAHLGSTGKVQELQKTRSALVRRHESPPDVAEVSPGDAATKEVFAKAAAATMRSMCNETGNGTSYESLNRSLCNGTNETDDDEDDDDENGTDADSLNATIIPHPHFSLPRMHWKDTPEAKEHLKKFLTCPGDYAAKANFSKPNMCSNASKMAICEWEKVDKNLGAICGQDCYCEAWDARDFMSMDNCKKMCADQDPCVFTFTSSKGCRVYAGCNESEVPESNETALALLNQSYPTDWVTCERFFEKYYGKTIAFHNELYNRFLMMKKQDNGLGIVTRTFYEVNIKGTNQISASMRFTVVNSSDSASLNQSPDDVNALTKLEETEHNGGSGDVSGAPGGEVGSPGFVALYSAALGDGQPWLAMTNFNRSVPLPAPRQLVGGVDIDENSIFTVCYLGPNEIALFNNAQARYVAMSLTGVTATKKHRCCSPPKSWTNARFTVVVPPPLTGKEDLRNDKVETPDMSTKEEIA